MTAEFCFAFGVRRVWVEWGTQKGFASVIEFMLRISRIDSSTGNVTLRLEGRLIGPWVDELRRCCATISNDEHQLALDLTEVLFADYKGLALLRTLRESNIRLAGCSPFLREQLK